MKALILIIGTIDIALASAKLDVTVGLNGGVRANAAVWYRADPTPGLGATRIPLATFFTALVQAALWWWAST